MQIWGRAKNDAGCTEELTTGPAERAGGVIFGSLLDAVQAEVRGLVRAELNRAIDTIVYKAVIGLGGLALGLMLINLGLKMAFPGCFR